VRQARAPRRAPKVDPSRSRKPEEVKLGNPDDQHVGRVDTIAEPVEHRPPRMSTHARHYPRIRTDAKTDATDLAARTRISPISCIASSSTSRPSRTTGLKHLLSLGGVCAQSRAARATGGPAFMQRGVSWSRSAETRRFAICEARCELGPLVVAPEGAKTREFMNGGPEHPARRGRSWRPENPHAGLPFAAGRDMLCAGTRTVRQHPACRPRRKRQLSEVG
jgi:hypothetical protein